jgi:hypothetical protein
MRSLSVLESWVGGKVEPFQQYSHGRCLMTMMMDLDLLLVMKSLDWKLLGIYGWEGLDGN